MKLKNFLIWLLCIFFITGCSFKSKSNKPKPTGFNISYSNNKLIYTDYDLNFNSELPIDNKFTFNFNYETPTLCEGAPMGRDTFTIYYKEEGQPLERNIIEIKSTHVGTREGDNFNETGLIKIDNSDKTYLIEEHEDGVRILSEEIFDHHCVKASLTKTAYKDLKKDLESIILSTKYLNDK